MTSKNSMEVLRWKQSFSFTIIIIWIVLSFALLHSEAVCPKLCHCKWRDGKETVACPNADFIDIPRGLDTTTQVLDLRRNNLKILPNDAFLDTGLVNLQKVWLNYCKLKYIIDGAFRHLANLIELDLSNNDLSIIPTKPLSDISGLRNLVLARNSIKDVQKEAFKNVPLLVKLDLSHNNISSVHENAFSFLNRLEDLKLSFNRLSTLPVKLLEPLAVLHGLHVDNNPWHCNCHLRLLRQWLLKRNVAASIPPKCTSPERLNGRGWQTLGEDEFVCVPLVTAVAQRVIASQGDNVTLACRVETDADAAVTWLVGDKAVVNATTEEQRKYSVLELNTAKSGSRVSNLTIEGAATQDQGTYRCVAENKAGRVETNLTLKVSEEVTEIKLISPPDEIKEIIPQWIFGAIGGGIGVIILIILLITFRFRRKSKRENSTSNILMNVEIGDRESEDQDSRQESLRETIHYINPVQMSKDNLQCNLPPKEQNISENENSNRLVFPSNENLQRSISFVNVPNLVVANGPQYFDISNLETILGPNFQRMDPRDFLTDTSCKYPDLLNLPNTKSGNINYHNMDISSNNSTRSSTKPRETPACQDSYNLVHKDLNQAGTSQKRHVHFQDEFTNDKDSRRDDGDYKPQLLQYHVAQLYRFLHEYKNLQDQLKSIKSSQDTESRNQRIDNEQKSLGLSNENHSNTSKRTSISDSVSEIQSSIEYLLAHSASIPPPIVDTINHLSTNREQIEAQSSNFLLNNIPPPPNYSGDDTNELHQHIIPPPSTHSSMSSVHVIPTADLPMIIPPPTTPSVQEHSFNKDNQASVAQTSIRRPVFSTDSSQINISSRYDNLTQMTHVPKDDSARCNETRHDNSTFSASGFDCSNINSRTSSTYSAPSKINMTDSAGGQTSTS